jgi:hypothetical protein
MIDSAEPALSFFTSGRVQALRISTLDSLLVITTSPYGIFLRSTLREANVQH